MVALGAAAVIATVVLTGGAGAPVVVAVATGGTQTVTVTTAATAAATAGTAGTAAVAAGGTAAAAGGTAAAGTVGTAAAVGGTAAAGGGTAAASTAAVLAGPVGWVCLGAEGMDDEEKEITFDCWKSLLHDESTEPSRGMMLRDVLLNNRVKMIEMNSENSSVYPEFFVRNVWDESFEVKYVILPSGQLAAHASAL